MVSGRSDAVLRRFSDAARGRLRLRTDDRGDLTSTNRDRGHGWISRRDVCGRLRVSVDCPVGRRVCRVSRSPVRCPAKRSTLAGGSRNLLLLWRVGRTVDHDCQPRPGCRWTQAPTPGGRNLSGPGRNQGIRYQSLRRPTAIPLISGKGVPGRRGKAGGRPQLAASMLQATSP